MYASFFGFKENPFNLTPDPRYLFPSQYHKEALEILLDAIRKRKGLITVRGDIGTGKTTLCRALLNKLESSTKSALVINSFISDLELLVTICQEFAVERISKAQTKRDYFDALNRFLLGTFHRGGNAVLLIDEAQNLSPNALRQILSLSELEEAKEKLIQIILVGQSELSKVLALPSLKVLSERIKTTYYLKPLEANDIGKYIEHRLGVAGGQGSVRFKQGALGKIYSYSEGNPRRINAVCDRALLIAYVKEKQTITKRMVETAIQELQAEIKPKAPVFRGWAWKRSALSYALLFFLLMIAGFAGRTLNKKVWWNFLDENERHAPRIVKPIPLRSQTRIANHQVKVDLFSSYEQINRAQKKDGQSEAFDFVASKPAHKIRPKDESTVPKALVRKKSPPTKRATLSVQVGAFLGRDNAERLVGDLKQKGYEPYISTFLGYWGREWYSVRILDCADLKEAERVVSEYRQKEGKPALITRLDSLTPVSTQNDEFDRS
jgi:general secretion pathway protein A